MASAVDRLKGENTRFLDFSKSLNNKLPNLVTPFVTKEKVAGFCHHCWSSYLSLEILISWDNLQQHVLGWNEILMRGMFYQSAPKDSFMLLQIDQCQENDEDSVQCSSH